MADKSWFEISRRSEPRADDLTRVQICTDGDIERLNGITITELGHLATVVTNRSEEANKVLPRIPANSKGTIELIGPDPEGVYHFLLPPKIEG